MFCLRRINDISRKKKRMNNSPLSSYSSLGVTDKFNTYPIAIDSNLVYSSYNKQFVYNFLLMIPFSSGLLKAVNILAQSLINMNKKATIHSSAKNKDNDNIIAGGNTNRMHDANDENIITGSSILNTTIERNQESSILTNITNKNRKDVNQRRKRNDGKDNEVKIGEIDDLATKLLTVKDYYHYAIAKFTKADLSYGHTTFDAYEEASFLIMHTLKLPIEESIENYTSVNLKDSERSEVLKLIHKRINSRLPLPYLINTAYQQGEVFYVDERVIIPRSYLGDILMTFKDLNLKRTEIKSKAKNLKKLKDEILPLKKFTNFDNNLKDNLNGLKLHNLIESDNIQNILDLCTGSGCLAVLACRVFPSVLGVDAVDLSSDALNVANINIENKLLQNKISVHQGDLYSALSSKNEKIKYDLIISNPPYVDLDGMRNLPKEFSFEPSLALDGGRDGLNIIHRILLKASENLTEKGGLLCEIGRCQPQFKKKYPVLSKKILWIDTENSSGEVFYVTKHILLKYFV